MTSVQNRPRDCAGVITIYLSLILVLTSAFIFTLTESARVTALKAKLQSIIYMAADSVFSEYAEPVFERYGVMMLWSSESDFLKKFEEHCKDNLADFTDSILYSDIYRTSYVSSALSSISSPTDNGGEAFAKQVNEYMHYYLVEDAAGRILDNISIFDQGEKVSSFMDRIEEYGEVFKKVEASVSSLKEKTDSVKKMANDPFILLSQASEDIENYINGNTSSAISFSNTITQLKKTKKNLTEGLESVREASDLYYENTEKAAEAVAELENELEIERTDFDENVYEIVSEQLEDIKQKSADTDFDYYLVGSNLDVTENYQNNLDTLDNLFEKTSDPLNKETAESYRTIINSFRQQFSDFDLSSLGVNLDLSEISKEDDGFLDNITEFFNSGILGFIAGDISDRSIDSSPLPSASLKDVSSSETDQDLITATEEKALFSEYILQHFGCCTSEKGDQATSEPESALEYETEYIIAGKSSDRDNLSTVVSDIVLIRTGCNLISILKSSSKKAETYALATSLAGFTGMPIVIKIFQILIIAAWALAESIADVKALIEGHRIKTIKDDTDWYLSLSGIKNFGSNSLAPTGTEKGLSYESYLRLLLLMQNNEKQRFRTMDMIQANMNRSDNPDFLISKCISSLSIQAEFSAQPLFICMPFVNSVFSVSEGKYSYPMTQKYSY